MITVRVSSEFIESSLRQGALLGPALVERGIPAQAQLIGCRAVPSSGLAVREIELHFFCPVAHCEGVLDVVLNSAAGAFAAAAGIKGDGR
jgi:hypothetical protein